MKRKSSSNERKSRIRSDGQRRWYAFVRHYVGCETFHQMTKLRLYIKAMPCSSMIFVYLRIILKTWNVQRIKTFNVAKQIISFLALHNLGLASFSKGLGHFDRIYFCSNGFSNNFDQILKFLTEFQFDQRC
jgi:hypothetical protein